jgi:predicted HAD superfamily Cof-like phosphohydrolase
MIVTIPHNGPAPGQGASGVHQLRIEDMARDVVAFHKKYGIQYDGKPRDFEPELELFRLSRNLEEVSEYCQAKTLEQKLDALLDQVYIILGTAHLHGFTPEIIYEAWSRIQKANMAKELAHSDNPGKYGDKTDIVKPKGWQAPNHSDLLQ